MAGTSPTRRSSRARPTQPPSQHSSAASSASGHAERSSRAFTKTGSPQKSTGSGSLSSEPPEDSATNTTDDTIVRRRSTRGKDEERDRQPKIELLDTAIISDEMQEDDEAVRCVCGQDEYPGQPPLDEDVKHGIKDAIDHDVIFSIDLTDEMAGFFVQCDICKVWQHGACVGIMTEESSPDEYFCEQCRKDLHKIYTASNGQKYSIYLPIHRPSRTTSRAASATKDGTRSPKPPGTKSTRLSAASQSASAKRRSTMNSRDAAYDEEEELRRAIEASREELIPEDDEPMARRLKRGRDDSDEKLETAKRQRTNSRSPSPAADGLPFISQEGSDDESGIKNGVKRSRNAARNQREKAERDERREEQERKRAEAASKRKGRAERRRADDSDPADEVPPTTRAVVTRATESVQPPDPPLSSQPPPPDTPPASTVPSSIQKKKPLQHKKGKGRNQYTKDRDNADHDESPARSLSRDVQRTEENGATSKASGHESNSRSGTKSKSGMNSKITMSDMKRRANAIMDFISRKQVELVNEPLSETQSSPNTDDGSQENPSSMKVNGAEGGHADKKAGDNSPTLDGPTQNGGVEIPTLPSKDFGELSCVEMMDVLTRDLVKWQQEYAV